jgi:CRISPR/Cas system-associated exonuclease Cas4 (RecB family)
MAKKEASVLVIKDYNKQKISNGVKHQIKKIVDTQKVKMDYDTASDVLRFESKFIDIRDEISDMLDKEKIKHENS